MVLHLLLLIFTAWIVDGCTTSSASHRDRVDRPPLQIHWDASVPERERAIWLGYLLARVAYLSEHPPSTNQASGAVVPNLDEEVKTRTSATEIYLQLRERDRSLDLEYFNDLGCVLQAGFMREYCWNYLRQASWHKPVGLRLLEFDAWRREHLAKHVAQAQGTIRLAQ